MPAAAGETLSGGAAPLIPVKAKGVKPLTGAVAVVDACYKSPASCRIWYPLGEWAYPLTTMM